MNKKFFIAWIVILVAWFAGSGLIHGGLLSDEYMQLTNLFRSDADAQPHWPYMVLAHIIMSGAFVWIYARGVEAKPPVGQGLRFGLAVALLSAVPLYMIYYVVQPMPGMLVVRQIAYDTILLLLLGVIVAFVYKAPARA